MNSGIYRIKNIKNNRRYYGSTTSSLKKRKKEHFNDLANNRHHNSFLQNDYNKWGKENFIFEILFYCNPKKVLFHEQQLLNLNFDNKKQCYNICYYAGNCLGRKHSKESKLKMSMSRLGCKNSFYGKKHKKESIEKIKLANLGKKLKENTKTKISLSNIGKKHTQKTKQKMSSLKQGKLNPFYGKKHSEEVKLKMSEKRKGKKHNFYDKNQYNFVHESGLKEKCTQYELRIKYNLHQSSVSHVVTGRRNKHKGWRIVLNEKIDTK